MSTGYGRLSLVKPTGTKSIPRYVVTKQILSSGERFCAIVDWNDGIPPTLALRYALSLRNKVGSARHALYVRRVGDLFNWLTNNWMPDPDQELQALPDISSAILHKALEGAVPTPALSAVLRPKQEKLNSTTSSRLTNERIDAWISFLTFVYEPALWKINLGVREGHELQRLLNSKIVAITQTLQAAREAESESEPHLAVKPDELSIIDEVLARNLCRFSAETVQRNNAMYYLDRFTAIRRGELLKVKDKHLPPSESSVGSMLRTNRGEALCLRIERDHDDPADPRANEPRVKRSGRVLELPNAVIELLNDYRSTDTKRRGSSPYLFLTEDGQRPLSISRADTIIRKIGKVSGVLFRERFPGCPHSLDRLTWHRLRTTRANELLEIYFPNNIWDPNAEDDFLYALGWRSRESARPYLRRLRRNIGTALLKREDDALRGVLAARLAR